ncbi:DUF6381 family protein [Streptomyces sp. NPDC055400]
MSAAGESGRTQQTRPRAQDLEETAARDADPQERQRLKDQARQLKEQSEHACAPGQPDFDPAYR